MANAELYYNTAEQIYCFMSPSDSRLKNEGGWKLWSIEDEPEPEDDDND